MKKHIITFDKEIDETKEKRIRTNLKKINNGMLDLTAMGYTLYLSPGSLNVCDGETHTGNDAHPDRDVIVASISLTGIDAGDW